VQLVLQILKSTKQLKQELQNYSTHSVPHNRPVSFGLQRVLLINCSKSKS